MQYGYDYADALRALRELQEVAIAGRVPRTHIGVCGNLTHKFGFSDGYEFVQDHSKDWPHAMFHPAEEGADPSVVGQLMDYFVPRTQGLQLWEGENLERRLDLIDFLIEKCEAVLAA